MKKKNSSTNTTPGSQATESEPFVSVMKAHEILMMDPKAIKPLTVTPDMGDSGNLHPVVARTDEGVHCIDQWERIKRAQDEGTPEIKVELFELSGHSLVDLVTCKLADRLAPRGKLPPYGNVIYCVVKTFEYIVESKEDITARIKSTGNRSVDVKLLLTKRLQKDEKTVNSYLLHARCLNDGALERLCSVQVAKAFFEAIQPEKSRMIKELEAMREMDTLTEKVSEQVLIWLKEYLDGGRKSDYSPTPISNTEPKRPSRKAKAEKKGSEDVEKIPSQDTEVKANESNPPKSEAENEMTFLARSVKKTGEFLIESAKRLACDLSDADLLVELRMVSHDLGKVLAEIEFQVDKLAKKAA